MSRNPLDVLMSILHFSINERQTNRWLDGAHGTEDAIRGHSPCSEAFYRYATGPRAAALLSVSSDWVRLGLGTAIRYEDLLDRPLAVFDKLCHEFNVSSVHSRWAFALRKNSFENLKKRSKNVHFWMGRINLWKLLLPPDAARHIFEAHRNIFDDLRYSCSFDYRLTLAESNRNWEKISSQTRRWTRFR